MIIAVDGPAASGKGTLSKRLANHLGYAHLDTGKIYRAVGFAVLASGGDPDDPDAAVAAARALTPEALENPGLTDDSVAAAASRAAAAARSCSGARPSTAWSATGSARRRGCRRRGRPS